MTRPQIKAMFLCLWAFGAASAFSPMLSRQGASVVVTPSRTAAPHSLPLHVSKQEQEQQQEQAKVEMDDGRARDLKTEKERADKKEQREQEAEANRDEDHEDIERRKEEIHLEEEAEAEEVEKFVTEVNGILEDNTVDDEQQQFDQTYMNMAIQLVQSAGGEQSEDSAFPHATAGAVLVTADGKVMGKGRSTYETDAVQAVIADAGLKATPLKEWCVDWVPSEKFRDDLASSTLYLTLEPSPERYGETLPPITKLIEQSGIPNVVIGCPSPIPEMAYKGATALHLAGLSVRVLQPEDPLHEECESLIEIYAGLANSKLQRMARRHFKLFGRPLGYLHCSVVDSDNVEAYARHGNAFGKKFGAQHLNFRDFGAYEIAPPPEVVWADDFDEEDDWDIDDEIMSLDFEEEDFQGGVEGNPMTPYYEQADAVVATFPRPGNGPTEDNSLTQRLNGLKWLATHGRHLPPGVERVLVMDATDLDSIPLTNNDPNCPHGADVEAFWKAEGRKPTRVLLRRGTSADAKAAAESVAESAAAAAEAAKAAKEAIETGEAAHAAEAAIKYQQAALEQTKRIHAQLEKAQQLKSQLTDRGVIVETIDGGEPIDVMKHLGKRSGLKSVVWRAGCWGDRGVRAVLAGAFQWCSAHLAVDATGGRFWQLMVAENAVQAACGPERKVKIFAEQEDLSLEYCDEPDTDADCSFTIDGRPIRHIRLDCRIALVDDNRPREFVTPKTKRIDRKHYEEQAPWFL